MGRFHEAEIVLQLSWREKPTLYTPCLFLVLYSARHDSYLSMLVRKLVARLSALRSFADLESFQFKSERKTKIRGNSMLSEVFYFPLKLCVQGNSPHSQLHIIIITKT